MAKHHIAGAFFTRVPLQCPFNKPCVLDMYLTSWHVLAHLQQKSVRAVSLVGYVQCRVQGRKKRTLRSTPSVVVHAPGVYPLRRDIRRAKVQSSFHRYSRGRGHTSLGLRNTLCHWRNTTDTANRIIHVEDSGYTS